MILFNCVSFQNGNSLKGENLLPDGPNSSLLEQFLIVWEITLTTLDDRLKILLFYFPNAQLRNFCNAISVYVMTSIMVSHIIIWQHQA